MSTFQQQQVSTRVTQPNLIAKCFTTKSISCHLRIFTPVNCKHVLKKEKLELVEQEKCLKTGPTCRCNRCSCIGPRASEGPTAWCWGSLFIFSVYWAQWHRNATAQRVPAPRVCIGPRNF